MNTYKCWTYVSHLVNAEKNIQLAQNNKMDQFRTHLFIHLVYTEQFCYSIVALF